MPSDTLQVTRRVAAPPAAVFAVLTDPTSHASIDGTGWVCDALGQPGDDGDVHFGGWLWRYDLAPADDDASDVTLTYDWSGAAEQAREAVRFPPFGSDHLDNSLAHLEQLARPPG